MVKNPLPLSISIGSDYAFTTVNAVGVGSSILTASTQGMSSAQGTVQLAPSPLVVQLTKVVPTRSFIFNNESAVFLLSISFLGQPFSGENVTWGSTGGQMSPPSGSVGASGTASSTFTPSTNGAINITASISAPAIGNVQAVYLLDVAVVPEKTPPTLVQVLLSLWYYIAAAVVVVAVAAFYLLRMRRKKQRAEIEAGFEVV